MDSDQDEISLEFTVSVPAPFTDGRILWQQGEWVQVEARRRTPRELREERGRRIYIADAGFPDALFRLLTDLADPATLPLWERGAYIHGCHVPEEK